MFAKGASKACSLGVPCVLTNTSLKVDKNKFPYEVNLSLFSINISIATLSINMTGLSPPTGLGFLLGKSGGLNAIYKEKLF